MRLYYETFQSPIGSLLLLHDGKSVVRIEYGDLNRTTENLTKWLDKFFPSATYHHQPDLFDHIKQQLEEYFTKKRRTFSVDLSLYGTDFQKKVWQALRETIPYGQTSSYKDIAVALGKPKAVRAVGGAVNKNPFSIIVPCHRVIGTNGKMVGYNGGLDKKAFLLEHEKI
ncbi:methylated-DNA--[protein]-cysteine S-methyltransferase [Oceanobacillus halotolerans]|uniref:methylated-DNA--[protein]-cysteine S-methyltransferase n=1 Tax=Oceanobacillus halotolerans TaxID=2663380 RepID=UPI0013DD3CBE|nr:methylated-DNA--[protein]-cysteine S-methyltransferase [Oceanobacillus halotolerans]